ncbi:chromosome partitioning protein ParB, partial [Leptospira stimsonii]
KDDLLQDNRGGDRKSESSKISSESAKEEETKQERSSSPEKQTELGSFGGVGTLAEQASLKENLESGSNDEGHRMIEKPKELAKRISEGERIPLGTARNYVSEIRKELTTKDPKPAKKKTEKKKEALTKKDKVKEFQKKYSKLSSSEKKTEVSRLVGKLALIRKKREKLETQVTAFLKEDSEIVEKLASVGEKKRVLGL